MKRPLTPKIRRPQPLKFTGDDWVNMENAFPNSRLLMQITPKVRGLVLADWAARHRDLLREKLHHHGAVLFRGFGPFEPADLIPLIRSVSDQPLTYHERSSPRTQVAKNIYSSTDYPPDQAIFLHNENSYQNRWPMKLFFLCVRAPDTGGRTPIADCRRVLRRIDGGILARFEEKGLRIVRNYAPHLGLHWQTVFQCQHPSDVEAHCRQRGIEVRWLSADHLRTTVTRTRLIYRHPKTSERVWFNHGTFFHISTLARPVRRGLEQTLGPQDYPSNTYYGDGSPIEPEVLDHLREAYLKEKLSFDWQVGDVLMIDNMLTAHGREPFKGHRQIVVGMAEPSEPPEAWWN